MRQRSSLPRPRISRSCALLLPAPTPVSARFPLTALPTPRSLLAQLIGWGMIKSGVKLIKGADGTYVAPAAAAAAADD